MIQASVMRLFVAIQLPDTETALLSGLCENLRARLRARLRWVPEDHLHLTLVFLGHVARDNFARLFRALQIAAGQIDPFEIGLSGGGWFPPRRPARVLWVGVEPAVAVKRLHDAVRRNLESTGVAVPDRRAYDPHVTLARSRPPVSLSAMGGVSDLLESVRGQPFGVDEMTLFESHTERTGARYEVLERFPLGGAGS